MGYRSALAAVALAAAALVAAPAMGRDATCYTTDDGEYPCDFVPTGDDGSFDIHGYGGEPSFSLVIESPGQAFVYATFTDGGNSVSLPGTYYRSESDGACWVSDATATEICAW